MFCYLKVQPKSTNQLDDNNMQWDEENLFDLRYENISDDEFNIDLDYNPDRGKSSVKRELPKDDGIAPEHPTILGPQIDPEPYIPDILTTTDILKLNRVEHVYGYTPSEETNSDNNNQSDYIAVDKYLEVKINQDEPLQQDRINTESTNPSTCRHSLHGCIMCYPNVRGNVANLNEDLPAYEPSFKMAREWSALASQRDIANPNEIVSTVKKPQRPKEKVRCPICSKDYIRISTHMTKSHRTSAPQIANVNRKTLKNIDAPNNSQNPNIQYRNAESIRNETTLDVFQNFNQSINAYHENNLQHMNPHTQRLMHFGSHLVDMQSLNHQEELNHGRCVIQHTSNLEHLRNSFTLDKMNKCDLPTCNPTTDRLGSFQNTSTYESNTNEATKIDFEKFLATNMVQRTDLDEHQKMVHSNFKLGMYACIKCAHSSMTNKSFQEHKKFHTIMEAQQHCESIMANLKLLNNNKSPHSTEQVTCNKDDHQSNYHVDALSEQYKIAPLEIPFTKCVLCHGFFEDLPFHLEINHGIRSWQ